MNQGSRTNPTRSEDKRAEALTKAALEAARLLGLSQDELCSLLGIQKGAAAAMRKGERAVDGINGEAERADALVRLVKRLHTLLGAGETDWRSWIRKDNAAFGCRPLDILLQRDGPMKVAQFLERADSL